MVARAVDQAAVELHALRRDAWQQVGVAVAAFAVALVASQLRPGFAVPLLIGGFASLILALRAFLRRFELLDRLVADRDAYVIPEVRRSAEQAATLKNRRMLAFAIRSVISQPSPALEERVRAAAGELEALAHELEDDRLALDPAAAVVCARLLNDMAESPLRNPAIPPAYVHSRVSQVLAGFDPLEEQFEQELRLST